MMLRLSDQGIAMANHSSPMFLKMSKKNPQVGAGMAESKIIDPNNFELARHNQASLGTPGASVVAAYQGVLSRAASPPTAFPPHAALCWPPE